MLWCHIMMMPLRSWLVRVPAGIVCVVAACALPEATKASGGGSVGSSTGTGASSSSQGGAGGAGGDVSSTSSTSQGGAGGGGGLPEIPSDGRTLFIGTGAYAASATKPATGKAYWWGDNACYQAGNGTNIPAQIATPTEVTQIVGPFRYAATTGATQCLLTPVGAVICVGLNVSGEVGNGTLTGDAMCGDFPTVTTPVTTIASGVEQLSAGAWWCGGAHFCARMQGKIHCWGDLGNCGGHVPVSTPSLIGGIDDAVHIASGAGFDCVIRADQTAWCWGENNVGQLGQGNFDPYSGPVQVKGLTGVTALGTGTGHACAQAAEGFHCWGSNMSGESGGDTGGVNVSLPTLVPGLSNVVQVAGTYEGTCARTATKEVYCWGRSDFGMVGKPGAGVSCGPNGKECAFAPVKLDIAGAVELTMGGSFALARIGSGSIVAWGDDASGTLGNGFPLQPSQLPVPVTGFP